MTQIPHSLDTEAAAAVVGLPAATVDALAAAGYIDTSPGSGAEGRFNLADLRAFVARNAANGAGAAARRRLLDSDLAPHELVELLDGRTEHMALRMLKMYSTVFPQVKRWPIERQSAFVKETKERFDAIMTVALGEEFDDELLRDLRTIGARAARRGVKLPEILLLLRISRDLVVQNAIELAGEGERHGAAALSLLLTRILPAMDRLGDTLAAGYWESMFPSG